MDQVVDSLGSEEEPKETIYSISSFGADFLVDGLIKRLDEDDIFIPDFQRQFVWTLPQASRFIESILLGLPIPGIFLYREEDTRKLLIIDGLQRLTTLRSFVAGRLPTSNRVFSLTKVHNRFEGATYSELEPADRRRLMDTPIHATIIQQNFPEDDYSSVFYIFERLNTGGTPLQPQEVRAALYHGEFQNVIKDLNEYKAWRKVYGAKSRRAKDQELVLRFLALLYNGKKYNEPMKSFLNDFMGGNRDLQKHSKAKMEKIFRSTVDFLTSEVDFKLFRPTRALNAAVFDSVMVATARNLKQLRKDEGKINSRYNKLLLDEHYQSLISRSTADQSNVRDRIEIATRYLTDGRT